MNLDFLKNTDQFQRFLKALRDQTRGLSVSGIVPSAKPYFLSLVGQEIKRPLVFIRPTPSSLSRLSEQCRFFWDQFGCHKNLSFLPALSDSPYQEIPPSLEAVSDRMRALFSFLRNPPSLLITNFMGLLKPIPTRRDLKHLFLQLEPGDGFGRDPLITRLTEYGYSKEELVNSPGEFAWRGGIVDVFSPWESYPFRIEFSGDEVVSLRIFQSSNQRSLRKVNRVLIPSLREFSGSSSFLQEWERKAFRLADGSSLTDLSRKMEKLRSQEFFPSFNYLSLLNHDRFVFFDQYYQDTLYIVDDREETEKEWKHISQELRQQFSEQKKELKFSLPPEKIYSPSLWEKIKSRAVRIDELSPDIKRKTFHFFFQSVPRFKNKIPFFLDYIKRAQEERERCVIYFSKSGVRHKLATLLTQHRIPYTEILSPPAIPDDGTIGLFLGELSQGFRFPPERFTCFAESDVFTEEKVLVSRPQVRPFVSDFRDLRVNDYVVHSDYGIGQFKGLVRLDVNEKNHEFIEIQYRDEDKLFVPTENLNLVQKYTQLGSTAPQLHKLGTSTWEKTKARTEKAIENMAGDLLELYAQRKAVKGHRFSAGGTWQSEFEQTFDYEETEDQLQVIKAIYEDMESESPMDRLVCGDVGYGKTEVAVRASFKAVMDGKQVAVLCPTTVLASQHLNTFRNRMLLFPIRVESLTRLQTRARQKKIVGDVQKGLVDIAIGTHRLLSKDIQFRELGMLVVDEEQRFGVKHKEKIKQMKTSIDVLTMTATPIPRTLNLSLSGLRDISLIETPPRDRLAIHTILTPFNQKLITSAIRKELARGGQVYFVHNRVEDIDHIASMIQRWVPQAKVSVVHGKMAGTTLERRMIDFIQQKSNVLVSTTIIENGIDIPLVNTLIVNRADRFGLAQLYQLRGRVGRSSRQAVAYFLVPPFVELTAPSKQRLKALQEFSELGSGFRLAAKDLEIRGAGNFLGAEQHGYVAAVGFDYYLHLLDRTVKRLKGEWVEEEKCDLHLNIDIRIPEDYIPQTNLRLDLYKRISSAESLEEIGKIKREIEDRYGPIPPSVKNLLHYGEIKFLAQRIKVKSIDRVGKKVVFKFFPTTTADLSRMSALLEKYSGGLTPQGVMSVEFPYQDEMKTMHETIFILKELSGM